MTAKALAMAIAVGAALISHTLVSFHIADDSSLRASIQDPVDPFLLAIGGLPLSSHLSVVHTPDRASEITTMRSLIFNEQRTWRIGSYEDGIDHPFYDGPVFHPGSLADRIRLYELEYVMNGIPESTKLLVGVAMALQSQMDSPETYAGFYRTMDTLITAPKATLDLTDEHFGDQRLGLRGFGMRRVNSDSFDETVDIASFGPTLLTNKQVAEVCNSEINTSLADLRAAGRLFVIDLSHLKQFHVTPIERKFTPAVIAHFCFNPATSRLLPLSIWLLDSGLTYSRFDSPNEWSLAKISLNAAETTQQQLAHFAETHAISIPLRVELYRNMAAQHPVRVLLAHHWALDFALEKQASVLLFNTSTQLDKTFGLGAVGSLALVNALLESGEPAVRALRPYSGLNSSEDQGPVESDARTRGLEHIPHKYIAHARLHYTAIVNFTRGFVDVFYQDDDAVQADIELTDWTRASAAIRHLHGEFPKEIESKTNLVALLARLVFLATVRHHAMNGETTWETLGMPYSAPALWDPLPSTKISKGGDDLELMKFLQPNEHFGDLVLLSAVFNRPRGSFDLLSGAYASTPIGSDPRLSKVIKTFETELQQIDADIVGDETQEPWPYLALLPTNLPHNNWV